MKKLFFIGLLILIARALQAAEMAVPRVYFPFAIDYLLPEMMREIDENVQFLKDNPEIYIILEGHCDDLGSSEYNIELGDRRARAVKAYMIEKEIPSERIIMVVSFGSSHPRNLGRTVEDMRENRRVEFVIR